MTFDWAAAWGVLAVGLGALLSFVVFVGVVGMTGAFVSEKFGEKEWAGAAGVAACTAGAVTTIIVVSIWVGLGVRP